MTPLARLAESRARILELATKPLPRGQTEEDAGQILHDNLMWIAENALVACAVWEMRPGTGGKK